MKVIITGSGGMLGRAVATVFPAILPGVSLTLATKSVFDITSASSVERALESVNPHILVNCAAYTKVDKAEEEKEKAFLANAVGPGILAEACGNIGSKFIHVSTDYVFSGDRQGSYTEDDPVGPQGVYGASKLEGERRVLAALPQDSLIVRTSWLYGPNGPNFVKTIANKGKELGKLKVVNDQTGSPTFTRDLAFGIARLIQANATGIVNVTNSGACTWYEFAVEILRLAGLEYVEVAPVPTSEYPTPAKRPHNSVLDNSKYSNLVGLPLRNWKLGLADYMSSGIDNL